MTKTERKKRILARGEHSGHCHVITGDVEFDNQRRILVGENSKAVLKHILEKDWMDGREIWTGEHADIQLLPGIYEYIPQLVFDPLAQKIQEVED